MPRVLFVSYYVPPRLGVGSLRARNLLQYLPAYGWEVATLTAHIDGPHTGDQSYYQTGFTDVRAALKRSVGVGSRSTFDSLGIEVPQYGSKRSFRQRCIEQAYLWTTYPDAEVGWFPHAFGSLRTLLREQRFDVILSSAPPMTVNLIVASAKNDTPWVADFRDLWGSERPRNGETVPRALDRALERISVSRAAHLTATSDESARELHRRFPNISTSAIPNGFDPSEWTNIPFGYEDRCTFVYAGLLYNGRRDPDRLFAALRSLLDEKRIQVEDVAVDFYTPSAPWLERQVLEYGLQTIVRLRGFVPRSEVLEAERRADRLIALLWDGENSDGILPAKLFEHLGARRSTIAIGGPAHSAVDKVLADTDAGVRARSVDDAKRAVMQAVEEHRSGNNRVLEESAVAAYSGAQTAKRMADVLELARSRPSRMRRGGSA